MESRLFSFCVRSLNLYRSIYITQVPMVRRKRNEPTTMTKEIDLDDEFDEFSPDEIKTDALETAYDMHQSELKFKQQQKMRIMTEKKFFKKPKQPNMLTWSEQQYIKSLHAQDPVQWDPKTISEAFPILPSAVKKILRNKWKPDNEEKIKRWNRKVLENWEKLKNNQLEADPMVLAHLKKFINRKPFLELQMKNPGFLPKPEVESVYHFKRGRYSKLLDLYQKQVQDLITLKSNALNKDLIKMNQEDEKNEVPAVKDETNSQSIIRSEIELEKESLDLENADNFMIGKLDEGDDRPITYNELKKEIFEKSRKNEDLSLFERAILDAEVKGRSIGKPDEKSIDITPKKSGEIVPSNTMKTQSFDEYWSNLTGKKYPDCIEGLEMKKSDPEVCKSNLSNNKSCDERFGRGTLSLKEGELHKVLYKKEESKPVLTAKKQVEYYGSEKDEEMVRKLVENIKETAVWDNRKYRKMSKDVGIYTNVEGNPHVPRESDVLFHFDYPEKIKIPRAQRDPNKVYQVNDCFYDTDGQFLFRVPALSE